MQHILRFILSLIMLCAPLLSVSAESDADLWTTYFAYADATAVVEADGRCYAVMNGNLMSYEPQTEEVRCYDGLNSELSSKDIAFIRYSEAQHMLVLVYSDGNIDLFDVRTERIINIPHFKNNPGQNFALRNLNVQDDDAFLCTAEGVIWISLRRGVIMGQYALGDVRAAALYENCLYASLATPGVLRVSLDGNPSDIKRWEKFSTLDVSDMAVAFGYLYLASLYTSANASLKEYGLWVYGSDQPLKKVTSASTRTLRRSAHSLVFWQGTSYMAIREEAPLTVETDIASSGNLKFTDIYPSSDGGYWGILPDAGLVHGTCEDGVFTADITDLKGDGPSFEHPYTLRILGGDLFVLGGYHDFTNKNHFPYRVAYLDADDSWHDFEAPSADDGWLRQNHDFRDVTSIACDPRDASHYYVTTFGHGIFEYRNGHIVSQLTEGNSDLHTLSPNNLDYIRTNSAIFDAQGNLFVTNMGVETSIWCLTPQGQWLPFHHPSLEKIPDFGPSIIDRNGRLWICQCTHTALHIGGFLCLDYNGTPANTADDVYTYRDSFINQDGSSISFHSGLSIAEDLDGRIWLGTDNGLYVVDDPDHWPDSDFLVTQVKVPRNDGTNYADYLLAGATINAIAVDGANCKWIGTEGDGIYVVSPDGTVILHHFTSSDSPLVSDIIWSLACHPETGEVFIGTDMGLMSYQSRTSVAADELNDDNVRIYPNPVRPDYDGPVTIDGLVFDCDVKIVSVSGHVVAAGISQGGTFTWDGRGFGGQRVGSGVYHVMMATPDGRQTAVGKIAIVR